MTKPQDSVIFDIRDFICKTIVKVLHRVYTTCKFMFSIFARKPRSNHGITRH